MPHEDDDALTPDQLQQIKEEAEHRQILAEFYEELDAQNSTYLTREEMGISPEDWYA